jgi:Fur family peroxide stress response transcriptional regulator
VILAREAKVTDGMRRTPQRLAILHYLKGNTRHPSAADIYRALSVEFPSISRATVYNTLARLTEEGDLRELAIDPEKRRYDPDTSLHHHLICTQCLKVVDVRIPAEVPIPEDERRGFEITGCRITFYGLCERCGTGH